MRGREEKAYIKGLVEYYGLQGDEELFLNGKL